MEVKLINIKDITNVEIFENVFNGKLGYDGIYVGDLNIAFFSKEAIREYYGNMLLALDEGYDCLDSEELRRIEHFINID